MDDAAPLTPAGRRVLDAAGELFYSHGINPVGVALVAETAGVTKKTLYDCFGSKEALVARYLRERHQRWWAHLERCLAGARDAGESGVLALFDAYVDHPELALGRGCAFLNAAVELPDGHPGIEVVLESKRAVRERLAELVADQDPGRTPDERADLTEAVYLVLEGAAAHMRLGDRERIRNARRLAAGWLGERERLDR